MLNDYTEMFLTEEDVRSTLDLPVLGLIPRVDDEGLRLLRDVSTFSPLMESHRWLRANLHFITQGADRPLRSLVVTSAVPAEGKSTTAANLAMALALDGKNVVLIDADLRRPVQQAVFRMTAAPGLVDVLVGTHAVGDVLRPSGFPNLRVLTGGTSSMTPTELLSKDALGELLTELESLCDIVIVDTSPTLAVADTLYVASRADAVLLVIAHGDTRRAHAAQARALLGRARANVLGAVFNRVGTGGSHGMHFYFGKYYVPTAALAEGTAEAVPESADDRLLHRRNLPEGLRG